MNAKVTLIYSSSGKRIIPVPPCGISMLGGILAEKEGLHLNLVDLECRVWMRNNEHHDIDFNLINHVDTLNQLKISPGEESGGLNDELRQQAQKLHGLLNETSDSHIYCISIMGYYQFFSALLLAWYLKQRNSQTRVILGGIFMNAENTDILARYYSLIDFIYIGTANTAFVELIDKIIDNSEDFSSVANIAYYKNGKVCVNRRDLSEKYPERFLQDQLSLRYYKQQAALLYKDSALTENILHVYVGDKFCPYKCNYCRTRLMKGKIINPGKIVEQIRYYSREHNIKLFNLLANEINPSQEYLYSLLNNLLPLGDKVKWLAYFKPLIYREDQFKLLYASGCRVIRFGVESGSQKVLDLMDKEVNVDVISRVLKLSHENNMWNHINIMIGYPFENDEDVGETIHFLRSNKDYIDSIRINPFYLPPDCNLTLHPQEYNIQLRGARNGYYEFDEIGGLKYEEKIEFMTRSIQKVLDVVIELGIGFQGILPFMLLAVYAHFENKALAKDWYRRNHPYTFQALSSEEIKARAAGKSFSVRNRKRELNWSNLVGKRGNNYNLRVECLD